MKFSRETVALIKQCIDKKWIPIFEGHGEDLGGGNCALCQKFMNDKCNGCPIQFYTGDIDCENSPYFDWRKHHYDVHESFAKKIHEHCYSCKVCALNEVLFLRKIHKRALLLMEI